MPVNSTYIFEEHIHNTRSANKNNLSLIHLTRNNLSLIHLTRNNLSLNHLTRIITKEGFFLDSHYCVK